MTQEIGISTLIHLLTQILLTMLYLAGFIGTVTTLAAWLLLKARGRSVRGLPGGFIIALGAYLIGLLFSGVGLEAKLGVFARDMLVVAVSGIAVMAMVARRKALGPGLLALGLLLAWFVQFQLRPTMQQAAERIELDADGELLIQISEGRQVKELNALIQEYGLDIQPAFSPASPEITQLDNYYVVNVPT
ncbi:MAG TPA: hypothetical protein PLL53_06825, partial [Saprospiraceae bacterium]|nr:hypothetical protein [Saprospiraceae bacterium]